MKLPQTQTLIIVHSLAVCLALSSCGFASNQATAPVEQAERATPTPSPVYSEPEKAAIAQLAATISGQFTAYIRQGSFVRDLQQLPGGIVNTDPNYDFQIAAVTEQVAYMTAIAKQPGLRSLSGQVFVLPESARAEAYRNSALSGSVCITTDPSNTPPIAPETATTAEPACPAGSTQVGVYYPTE